MSSTKVIDFYSGKNILITGASGFVGTILLEKVIRTVPEVGTIYVLIRPKSGIPGTERFEEVKKCPIFETLLETKSIDEIFAKVKVIEGDMQHKSLGLSEDDRNELIENVNVTFHVAATIDFADSLKTCLQNNLLGTRRILELCKEMKSLAVFVDVSSCYANSWNMNPEEKIYELNQNVDKLAHLADFLSDRKFSEETPKMLGPHPNQYTFSKYLAEYQVSKYHKDFPCSIVRPSIIAGTWQDPKPNYPISPMGPHGLLQGMMRGAIRRIPGKLDNIVDYIPVDMVVNNIMVAGCYTVLSKAEEATVFHCTSSTRNPFRWRDVMPYLNEKAHVSPFNSSIWYPYAKIIPDWTLFRISAVFFHFLPAVFLDVLLLISGNSPILVKTHVEAVKLFGLFSCFFYREWHFHADKTQALHEWLSPEEKRLFNLDISSLKWPEYFWGLSQGIKKYELNESLDDLEAAKRKDQLFGILNIVLQALVMFAAWAIVCSLTKFSLLTTLIFVPIYYYIFNILL